MPLDLKIDDLLKRMVQLDASDLHLKVGSPPGLRLHGEISRIEDIETLKPDDTKSLAQQILDPEQFQAFEKCGDFDCAYSIAGLSRFRVNALMQRGSIGMVFRKIPMEIPNIDDLNLPPVCKELAMKPRGLVLVTGPTGSGKSTTLAAMIDYRNRNECGHILTMEDPIEFIHSDKKSFVTQREIGGDTESFKAALKRALRQDPDVILVGELRDLETVSLAITAAETGHLVFGTLHTTGAIKTMDRIIDVFPPEQQQQIRMQLSGAVQGVVSQVLVPKKGGGRVAAHEIMIAVDAIRACVREGKTQQLLNILQTGSKFGMQLLDPTLAKLVKAGVVELEDALAKSNNPDSILRAVGAPPTKAY